jgi:hypothetical protein
MYHQKHGMNDTECRDRSIDDNWRSYFENRKGFPSTEILDSTEHNLKGLSNETDLTFDGIYG